MRSLLSIIWGATLAIACFSVLTALQVRLSSVHSQWFGEISGALHYAFFAFVFGFLTTIIANPDLAKKTLTLFMVVLAITIGTTINMMFVDNTPWQSALAFFIAFSVLGNLIMLAFVFPSLILEYRR